MTTRKIQENLENTGLQRILLLFTIFLNGYALFDFWVNSGTRGSNLFLFIILAGAGMFVLECLLLVMTWTSHRSRIHRTHEGLVSSLASIQWLNLLILAFSISFFSYLILGQWGEFANRLSVRVFLLWLLVVWGAVLIQGWSISTTTKGLEKWEARIAISLILCVFGYKVAFYFQNISFYPFTLTWSETSRYYYASLFLSKHLYGASFPPTVLHPSRYLMQAAPFLLPDSPLWLHRAWQVFLWLGTTFLTGWVLVHRLGNTAILRNRLLILWIAAFLLLGPVYYHLLVPAIIILWGFNVNSNKISDVRRLKPLLCLFIASAWAGMSRVNWYPVPGLLASALFFLETPVTRLDNLQKKKQMAILDWNIVRYTFKPVLWTLFGTIVALVSQAAYIKISGNNVDEFTTSFSSDLLWHRLLPNPTYPPGILPAAIAVSLPLFLIILSKLIHSESELLDWKRYHLVRYLGLVAILAVLFVGGLVVSVKIGGGSNLHNLDAYMTLLVVVSVYFYLDQTNPDIPASPSTPHKGSLRPKKPLAIKTHLTKQQLSEKILIVGITLTLVMTAIFTISTGSPAAPLPESDMIEKSMQTIKEFSRVVVHDGGEVLFISNRHLITFGDLEAMPLVPDYERVFLMEMAMANNAQYLERFQNDIRSQRFALIVTEPLSKSQKPGDEAFGAENNAWTKRISKTILCYYKPEKTFRPTQIQLLVPDPDVSKCP